MNPRSRRIVLTVLVVALFLFGLLGGILVDRVVLIGGVPARAPSATPSLDFGLLREAWDTVKRVYVDRTALKSKALTYGAIAGMVDALGDTGHSTFLSPDMVQEERSLTEGEYVGVGIEIQIQNNQVTIVAPLDGSPAFAAGLRSGEVILKVDGNDITGLTLQQVVRRIVGPVGTHVSLTIFSPLTRKTFDVDLMRARIRLHNVTWAAIPGSKVADLRIAAFSQGVGKEVRAALLSVEQGGYDGVVLDLRNDPGGVLDEAISVASEFLPGGNVLLEKNAQGSVTPVAVKSGGVATTIPMTVLIDGGTASASEIVAGALQDAKRARLIGEKSFGTGTVLGIFPLSDGSELLLATEEWLTPSGRVIWHKGIAPDVPVTLPLDATLLEPDVLRSMTAEQFAASGDVQLKKALELLSSDSSPGAAGGSAAGEVGGAAMQPHPAP